MEFDYDPKVTSYEALLRLFWKNHDPTSKCTRQYMSAIFYHDEEQLKLAKESMEDEVRARGRKVTTQILPVGRFYVAEE